MNEVIERDSGVERAGDVLDAIGNTPLIRLSSLERDLPFVELYGKAEFLNPGGSVKDRAARAMILDGERTGRLRRGKTILDATSGNTGIAYAMIGAARGYDVTLCLPSNANAERKRILRAYGATLVLTDPTEGTDGAIRAARELNEIDPDRFFYPDQYNNPWNWRAHYETTAEEIWRQTDGRITHFVAALGTTGTFVGTGRRLRELDSRVTLVSLEPDGPFHGLEGMKHLETALVPGIYDPTVADRRMEVSTEAAYAMARRLAREAGVFVGVSAAGAVDATLRLARETGEGVFVTVLCDGGMRYLSEHFWDDPSEAAR